ncbi:hypothetical protein Pmani_025988 [Petrolisthes manimaculis]|uniref:Uncharacterized protein n=1 Tax=Petrolisthes manimaculis TaxID=1843537 RepID=A0AAE1P4B7_9EUCA|nr:hypothetical protein Pmani_025988 [Petrolisthes manimaculis]
MEQSGAKVVPAYCHQRLGLSIGPTEEDGLQGPFECKGSAALTTRSVLEDANVLPAAEIVTEGPNILLDFGDTDGIFTVSWHLMTSSDFVRNPEAETIGLA